MARAGRKRSAKPRNKDGRCKRETVDEIRSVAVAQRAKVVPIDQATSEKASTPLGVLYLNGKLTLAEYQAGVRLTAIIARGHTAMLGPNPNPCSMGGRGGGRTADEDAEATRHSRAIADYEDALGFLKECGETVKTACLHICGSERPVMSVDPVKRGLKALVAHFGLQHFEERG